MVEEHPFFKRRENVGCKWILHFLINFPPKFLEWITMLFKVLATFLECLTFSKHRICQSGNMILDIVCKFLNTSQFGVEKRCFIMDTFLLYSEYCFLSFALVIFCQGMDILEGFSGKKYHCFQDLINYQTHWWSLSFLESSSCCLINYLISLISSVGDLFDVNAEKCWRWRRWVIIIFRIRVGGFFLFLLKSIIKFKLIIINIIAIWISPIKVYIICPCKFSIVVSISWGRRCRYFPVSTHSLFRTFLIILKYNHSWVSRGKFNFIIIFIRIKFRTLWSTSNIYSRGFNMIVWISKIKFRYFVKFINKICIDTLLLMLVSFFLKMIPDFSFHYNWYAFSSWVIVLERELRYTTYWSEKSIW